MFSPVGAIKALSVRRLAPAALIPVDAQSERGAGATRCIRSLPLAALILVAIASSNAADIGTAFSYQGSLEKPAGTPVTDTCDFRFGLWDALTGGNQKGTSPQTETAVDVVGGVFTVPLLDFGPGAIDGTARWLAIEVQCPGDAAFVLLDPRVELTTAPYSIRAGEGVGGPNALNVTPSGDVGIGTTAPAARLDVNGAARTTTLEITGGSQLQGPLAGWGRNDNGQTDIPSGMFIAVAGSVYHSLGLRGDGTLVGWGSNSFDQLNLPAPNDGFVAIATGDYHDLAIRSDGTLVGWGVNGYGQINVPSGTFTSVSAGNAHSLAIRSDGTLVGWGLNDDGQTNVPSGTFIAVAAGGVHSLAIRSDGTLVGWGYNAYGQINVPSGTFTAVAAGDTHSLAIRSDGMLVAWGCGFPYDYGQCNVPSGTFIAVAAGALLHSLAVRSDGTLIGWGWNSYGQTDVPSGTFTSVAAGYEHGLAIRVNAPPPNPALLLHTNSAVKPGTNTWTIYSDRRLKKNIEPLSGALDHLLQLRGVTFQWLDPASQGGITGTQMGLIADEVSRAFPQWVGRDPKGYQTLTVGGFEALTAEALRELRAEKDRQLDEKDCKIEELRSEIEKLKEGMDRRP